MTREELEAKIEELMDDYHLSACRAGDLKAQMLCIERHRDDRIEILTLIDQWVAEVIGADDEPLVPYRLERNELRAERRRKAGIKQPTKEGGDTNEES